MHHTQDSGLKGKDQNWGRGRTQRLNQRLGFLPALQITLVKLLYVSEPQGFFLHLQNGSKQVTIIEYALLPDPILTTSYVYFNSFNASLNNPLR